MKVTKEGRAEKRRAEQTSKRLIGKTVTAVDLNAFEDDCGGFTYAPVIRFGDGTELAFCVDETDSGSEYGVMLVIRAPEPVR